MINFADYIQSINNPNQLYTMKESIKDQVVDPNLRWDERMALYKKVQIINDWLAQLPHRENLQA